MVNMQAVYRAIAIRFGCSVSYALQVDRGLKLDSTLYHNVRNALDIAHAEARRFEALVRGEAQIPSKGTRKVQAA